MTKSGINVKWSEATGVRVVRATRQISTFNWGLTKMISIYQVFFMTLYFNGDPNGCEGF